MKESLKNNRYLGAALIAPLLIFLFIGGIYLKVVALILSLLAMYELYTVVRSTRQYHPIPLVGYGLMLLYFFLGNNIESISYIIPLATMVLLMIPVINLKKTFIDVFLTLGVFLYGGVFFSFIPGIFSKANGNYLVWLIFISSWLGDTAAYYSGRFLGKRKLCPEISPKKTVEGSIGGLLGSILGCGLFGILFASKLNPVIPLVHFFLIGGICGIIGQFGDLAASSIKRYFGVKDYSHLIPGHGGILDRFDSIIFSSVALFYYLTFILGI